MSPRPLDPDTFPEPMREHVRWHLLMTEADELTHRTGLGLASVWHHVKAGRYDAARARLTDAAEHGTSRASSRPPSPTEMAPLMSRTPLASNGPPLGTDPRKVAET